MKPCVVIGSGIAGLAAAIRLKLKGYDVTVLEGKLYPGGKLSELHLDGFRFDAGPSLLTMPHMIEELFDLCHEDIGESFQYIKTQTAAHYFYEDGSRFVCPANSDELAELLAKQFGEDKQVVLGFLNRSADIYRYTAPVFLERSLHKLSTYFSLAAFKGVINLWRLNMFSTMNAINSKKFKNPKTVQFFNRFATYNGSNPFKAPATLNVIPHLEFGFGTFFPVKGMYSITNALYELALKKGVHFEFGKFADEIRIEKSVVKGVRVQDHLYKADLVVCNMDVYPAYTTLLKKLKMPNKIKKSEPSSSALIFYWGINKQFEELGLHNIFFSKNYEREFDAIFKDNNVYEDPTVYINISSKHQKNDAPEACENWFVMVNVPANIGQDWDKMIIEVRNNVLDKLSRILGMDIRTLILCESTLDPRGIEIKTSSHLGSLYGTSSNSRLSAFLRHANFKSGIKNLYFCGGSVHPGGGIPLCLLGAKIVADMVQPSK